MSEVELLMKKHPYEVHQRESFSSISSGENYEDEYIIQEKNLVRKLDRWLLPYICLGYFIKSLDASNVSNAYVSGMKEELGMVGNQYNLLSTYFNLGYVLGQLASQVIICFVRPSIWLPLMEVGWSVLVVSLVFTKDLHTWYLIRFIIGLMEASAFPGLISLLGTWYTGPGELVLRSCIFQSFSSISSIFSGFLQAWLYKYCDGLFGIPAWKWIFIIDGIIGIPIAIYGIFAIPDHPVNSRAVWLSDSEKRMSLTRMHNNKRQLPLDLTRKGVLKGVFVKIFRSWPVYLFSGMYMCHQVVSKLSGYMNLWLKWTGDYSVEAINIIPVVGSVLVGVVTVGGGWLMSRHNLNQKLMTVSVLALALVGALILVVIPKKGHNAVGMLGWYLVHLQGCGGTLIMTLINQTVTYSYEQRLIIIGIVQTLSFLTSSWVPLVIFDSSEAPNYPIGYHVTVFLLVLEISGVVLVDYILHREKTRRWWMSPVG